MSKAYETVKTVYDQHFSDDPKKAASDPLFYMLERLFFVSYDEDDRRMEKISDFMNTLPNFHNKERITKLLHYYVSQLDSYPWKEGHSVEK